MAHFDPFIGDVFEEALACVGVNCRGANATAIERDKAGFTLRSDEGDDRYDVVLSAIGRVPNIEELNLDATGVDLAKGGAVLADEHHATNVEGIYAIGDVTGRAHALTPVAIAAGRRFADRLFGGASPRPINPETIPSAVFSHPPIGSVGLTESEARRRYGNDTVRVCTNRFKPLTAALTPEKQDAAVKLVVCGKDERVIGLHVIGEGADELLQSFAVAMRMGATKRDLDDTVAIHPTLAEEIVTLR